MVGYLSLNEDTGTIVHNGSSNGNNGAMERRNLGNGKYGNALAFASGFQFY